MALDTGEPEPRVENPEYDPYCLQLSRAYRVHYGRHIPIQMPYTQALKSLIHDLGAAGAFDLVESQSNDPNPEHDLP